MLILVSAFHCCDQTPKATNLKKEELIWAHVLSGISPRPLSPALAQHSMAGGSGRGSGCSMETGKPREKETGVKANPNVLIPSH